MNSDQQPKRVPLQALCELRINLVRVGSAEVEGRLTEINRNGGHIAIAEVGDVNQVIRLRLEPDGPPINFLGRVLQHVTEEDATESRPPGMSVTIFAMEGHDRDRWSEILEKCVDASGNQLDGADLSALPEEADWELTPKPLPDDRRQHERYRATLAIRMYDMSSLFQMYSRDISAGGAFIQTDKPLEINSLVRLAIIHPITNVQFDLKGKVVRQEETGAGISFVGMDEQGRRGFMRFIVTGRLPE